MITPLARVVANRALARSSDQATDEMMRPFFCLPLMHSELVADQDRCVRLHEAFSDPELLKYATLHRDIVVKFGRFPHRTVRWAAIRRQRNRSFWTVEESRGSALRIPRPQGAISAVVEAVKRWEVL